MNIKKFTQFFIDQLISTWDVALRRGQAPSAEKLCRDHPEPSAWLEQEIMTRELLRLGVPSVDPHASGAAAPGHLGASDLAPLGLGAGAEPVPGYRLMARIGVGSSAEVWKAVGPGGVPLAMKFIHLGEEDEVVEARSPASIRKVCRDSLRSLELMREVRHANLLPLFGAWQRPSYLIVGMEVADGTLMDRCNEAVRQGLPGIPLPELIEYMQQGARGIDFLNEPRHTLLGRERVGIQHRDIKPQNLLLVGGVIKVGDFGLAKLLEDAIMNTGGLTPAYAAPEFFLGRSSSRSDQNSLAVTYCQVRGGRLPFVGSYWDVMKGHVLKAPDLSMLPKGERPAVARALAKRPEERWPDCRTFVAELAARRSTEARRRGSPPARRAPEPTSTPHPGSVEIRRRNRWVGASGLLAFASIPIMVALSGNLGDLERASHQPDRKMAAALGGRHPSPPDVPVVAVATPDGGRIAPGDGTEEGLGTRPIEGRGQADASPSRQPSRRAAVRGDGPARSRQSERDGVTVSSADDRDNPGRPTGAVWATLLLKLSHVGQWFLNPTEEERRINEGWRKTVRATAERWRIEAELKALEEQRKMVAERRRAEEEALKKLREQRQADEAVNLVGEQDEAKWEEQLTKTATIHVFMPSANSELVVRGEVGKGNPDEWYGPMRVIHTPPMKGAADYLIGAFWLDSAGRPLTRKRELRIEPGRVYEVDLRPSEPTRRELKKPSTSINPLPRGALLR
jgi:serine/threonine protein kinase